MSSGICCEQTISDDLGLAFNRAFESTVYQGIPDPAVPMSGGLNIEAACLLRQGDSVRYVSLVFYCLEYALECVSRLLHHATFSRIKPYEQGHEKTHRRNG